MCIYILGLTPLNWCLVYLLICFDLMWLKELNLELNSNLCAFGCLNTLCYFLKCYFTSSPFDLGFYSSSRRGPPLSLCRGSVHSPHTWSLTASSLPDVIRLTSRWPDTDYGHLVYYCSIIQQLHTPKNNTLEISVSYFLSGHKVSLETLWCAHTVGSVICDGVYNRVINLITPSKHW